MQAAVESNDLEYVKANPCEVCLPNAEGHFPLYYATTYPMAKLLCDLGATVGSVSDASAAESKLLVHSQEPTVEKMKILSLFPTDNLTKSEQYAVGQAKTLIEQEAQIAQMEEELKDYDFYKKYYEDNYLNNPKFQGGKVFYDPSVDNKSTDNKSEDTPIETPVSVETPESTN